MALFFPSSLLENPFAAVQPQRRRNRRVQQLHGDVLDSLFYPFLFDEDTSRDRTRPRARQRIVPTKWVECVQLPGFAPEDVKAEVKDGKAIIRAKRQDGDADNQNVHEMKRTVTIPADVDASKVTCHYVPRRFVLVEGPRIQKSITVEMPIKQAGAEEQTTLQQTGDTEAAKPRPATEEEAYSSDEEDMVNIMKNKQASTQLQTAGDKTVATPANFEVALNMKGYEPDKVSVTRDGRSIIISAERRVEGDYLTGTESFARLITLPDNVDVDNLRCFMRDDGHLAVSAPYANASDVNVPIQKAE